MDEQMMTMTAMLLRLVSSYSTFYKKITNKNPIESDLLQSDVSSVPGF